MSERWTSSVHSTLPQAQVHAYLCSRRSFRVGRCVWGISRCMFLTITAVLVLRREAVKTAVMIPVAILRCLVALLLLTVLAGLSFTAALGWCGLAPAFHLYHLCFAHTTSLYN